MNPSENMTPTAPLGSPGEHTSPNADTAAGTAPQASPKIIGYCRECGKGLLEGSAAHAAFGAIYCDVHRPGVQTIVNPHEAAAPAASAQASVGQPPAAPWTVPASSSSPFSAGSSSAGPVSSGVFTASPYHASQPLLPPSSPLQAGASPGLAFVLGLIPGVGAVYNGQYAKGLLHVVILGLAISLNNSGNFEFGPLFGLLITGFWFYMAFEAYHTAKLRRAGMPVDEFSSVFPHPDRGAGPQAGPRVPVGPVILIVVGVLFLLSNLEIIEMRRLMRFWPALLIVMGVYMIFVRVTEARPRRQPEQEKQSNVR